MRILLTAPNREQSQREEIANTVSHGIGLVAALVGSPFLIRHAARNGDAGFMVGTSLFAATMVLLYLASTFSTTLYRWAITSACFGESNNR